MAAASSALKNGGELIEPALRARVEAARALQQARAGTPNALLDRRGTDVHCRLASSDQRRLERAIEQMQLSARAMHRILRVARTVADLAGSEDIATAHLTEALGYRNREAVGAR
jgi:magnesium chelatase family protein